MMPTAVILAGGQSHRMGRDKAIVDFHGKRLIDHVVDRLSPQACKVLLSAGQDYGTGFDIVSDAPDFEGPVAGLYGIADWLAAHDPNSLGFLTVPVDGPYLPPDLATMLCSQREKCAVASDAVGSHATFAYWTLQALRSARPDLPKAPSLFRLAKRADARQVVWPGTKNFVNLNTPDDVANNPV